MTVMQVSLASRQSPDATSNEDFIAATAGVVVVVDGASVPSGLATGCVHGTAWFARRLGVQLLGLLTTQADYGPGDSLAQAISDVASMHADTCDLSHPGSPSATVAFLREQPETVDYLVLGDTTILLEEPAGIRVITDDRLEHIASVQHSAMHQHATGPPTMTGASLSWSPSSAATATIQTASGSPVLTQPPPSTP
jgi:hypothetical protein